MKRLLVVGLGLLASAILTGCCCCNPCGGGCGFGGGCGPGGCPAPMGVSYQAPCNGSCAY